MRLLYVACRWDPTIQDEYSGSDYGAYHMLKKDPDFDVALVGPFEDKPNFFEKVVNKIYRTLSSKRLIKYFPSTVRESGEIVNKAIREYNPDVIFSKYSAPMVHTKIDRPFVYMCDSTIQWTKKYWREFSDLGFQVMEKWEEKSIKECNRIVTFSNENAEIIKRHYKKDPKQIRVIPIPAYIPPKLIPKKNSLNKKIGRTLNLLLVGKRFRLRGVDIAIKVVKELNKRGVPARLQIVGMNGDDSEFVKFMGVYDKEKPLQLEAYYNFFGSADLLIHPSRFHAAGIVISEAAAFGVPTITNDTGGLATSVLNRETGIVLPEASTANDYCDEIEKLINATDFYQALSQAARARFDNELNWEKAGERLREIVNETL
ncbi:MAG: glycosyltransferase family 4 protein [Pseudomonadota bacterium]|nr:glycosyltransferase family 4 protein [Pseudomonadota bacterium]